MTIIASHNLLTSIPDLRASSSSLQQLDLMYNALTSIPDLSYLTNLRTLSLQYNNISDSAHASLPASLHLLRIHSNALTKIPATISGLVNLTALNLEHNQITTIDSFVFPSSLLELVIFGNQITQISSVEFANNESALTTLNLSYNPLTHISVDAFDQMVKLRRLFLRSTQLTRLPLAIETLTLSYLDLSANLNLTCTCQESGLAPWVTNMTSLRLVGDCNGVTVDYFLAQLAPACPPPPSFPLLSNSNQMQR